MSIFKSGYEAVSEVQKQQEEAREKASKGIWRFFLRDDGDEAEVRFLTEVPVNFYEHSVRKIINGKEAFVPVLCTQDTNCKLCKSGDKPTFRGAYLIWDMRPYKFTTKDGEEKEGAGQIRLYVQGVKVLGQLKRISVKYGLCNRSVNIIRTGKSKNTSYTIEKGDSLPKLSFENLKSMLPEKLQENFTQGTQDEMMTIIEEALSTSIDTELDTNEPAVSESYNETLRGVQDDDDEDEKPAVKPSVKPTLLPNGKPKLFRKG